MSEGINATDNSRGLRPRLEQALLSALRQYTFHTPIAKGKFRVADLALSLCKYPPKKTEVPTRDGRRLYADLKTGSETLLYFQGTYETALTEMVSMLVREGDVCIDVGANFGWYTTLLRKLCGDTGSVHAFEPVPPILDELIDNYRLMGSPANVVINNLALGEAPGEIEVNLFSGLSTGHASMSDRGREDAVPFRCKIVTLDSYLKDNRVGPVNFVKVDIEGAEMMFLRGAVSLFKQAVPPIVLMEMALEQTGNFGYEPDDLIKFIAGHSPYDFYAVNEYNGTIKQVNGFASDDIGANVFCIPQGFYEDRTGQFLQKLADQ
jgi:FkbM family methyltransferase